VAAVRRLGDSRHRSCLLVVVLLQGGILLVVAVGAPVLPPPSIPSFTPRTQEKDDDCAEATEGFRVVEAPNREVVEPTTILVLLRPVFLLHRSYTPIIAPNERPHSR